MRSRLIICSTGKASIRDTVRFADGLDLIVRIGEHRPGHLDLFFGHRPRRSETGHRPLADQLALELGQRAEDVKDQLAARSRRVDIFLQGNEADLIFGGIRTPQ